MNQFSHTKKAVLLLGLIGALALNGCVVVPAHRYAARSEVTVGVYPPVGYVWFDGYWSRGYGRHWVPGHWGPRR